AHHVDRLLSTRVSAARGRCHTLILEALDEALVLAVGRQHHDLAVDQLLVGLVPRVEVAEIVVELGVAEDDRHAHLVAAPELDVKPRRILRARCEAGVERRLVPVEIHALRRLASVPRRLTGIEGRARADRKKEHAAARRQQEAAANDTKHAGNTGSTDSHRRSPGHLGTSDSERRSFAEAVTAPPSSTARAGTFLTLSLPMNGRDWNSQSFPCENPNSMSHGRGRPWESLAGSSFWSMAFPAATISSTSFGESTSSLPLDGTIRVPPFGSSAFFHADL